MVDENADERLFYHIQLWRLLLEMAYLRDAVKWGDGGRIIRHCREMTLWFYLAGRTNHEESVFLLSTILVSAWLMNSRGVGQPILGDVRIRSPASLRTLEVLGVVE